MFKSLTQRFLLGLAGCSLLAAAAHADDAVQKLKIGYGDKAISPIVISLLIPEALGYYKQEGLSVEVIPAGSNAAVTAGVENKRLEFGTMSATNMIARVADKQPLANINFFEYAYPFKFGIAVKPGSSYKSLADLKGKKIGVSSFGNSEYVTGQALFRLAKVDPEKDISWLAVGEGVTSGIALQRGDVDALVYYDTGFGQIEASGIKLDYLPLPPNTPMIGGNYLSATPDFLKEHRAWAVGMARAVVKAQIFIQENPEAAAYVYAQMFPEALPKGMAIQDQVKAVMVSVVKHMPLYASYDKSVKWGFIKESEWKDEISFRGFQDRVHDATVFYTNDLIDDINKIDADKIKAEARAYKLPYKK